jgi:ABC-type branched-subunit amino acid transport system substrate-binding protein
MDMAIAEVNADPLVLPGLTLEVMRNETDGSTLGGMRAVAPFLREEAPTLGILGPLWTTVARGIVPMVRERRIPTLAISATAASLSGSLSRMVPGDKSQAEAIVSFIAKAGWSRFAVIATDDDYGREGTAQIGLAAQRLGVTLTRRFEVAMAVGETKRRDLLRSGFRDVMSDDVNVIVLFAQATAMDDISAAASSAGAMPEGFTVIATDAITASTTMSVASADFLRGGLGLRPLVNRDTALFRRFIRRLQTFQGVSNETEPSFWAPFVYDAVYTFAHALEHVRSQHGNESLSCGLQWTVDDGCNSAMPSTTWDVSDGSLDLTELDPTDLGPVITQAILEQDLPGASGDIAFTAEGDRAAGYEIVNFRAQGASTISQVLVGTAIATNPTSSSSNITISLTDSIHWRNRGLVYDPNSSGAALGSLSTTPRDYRILSRTLRVIAPPAQNAFVHTATKPYDDAVVQVCEENGVRA